MGCQGTTADLSGSGAAIMPIIWMEEALQTPVFKGKVLNSLTDNGEERPCGDILYFVDAGEGSEGDEIIVHEDEGMVHSSGDSIW